MPPSPLPPGLSKDGQIHIRLNQKDIKVMKDICRHQGITITQLIVKALNLYIENEYDIPSPPTSPRDLPDVI
jgi:hypothetical protein